METPEVDGSGEEDATGSEPRKQPELDRVGAKRISPVPNEFEIDRLDDGDEDAHRTRRMIIRMQAVARQVSLDPDDGMEL